MFENFKLTTKGPSICGYAWEVENPIAVLCIIHGIGEHAGRYDRMATFLGESRIAVLSMDLPGHGASEGVRGDAAPRETVLDDVTALIGEGQRRYPGVPLILYGHSMGGNICLDYRSRGEKNTVPAKYIVSAPWVRLVRKVSKSLVRAVRAAARIAPKLAVGNGCSPSDLGSAETGRAYQKDRMVHGKITLRCMIQCFDLGIALSQGTQPSDHRADDIPTLLMQGDADRICSPDGARAIARLQQNNPHFTYIEWPGYKHEIHNGGDQVNGAKVLETIRDYIIGD